MHPSFHALCVANLVKKNAFENNSYPDPSFEENVDLTFKENSDPSFTQHEDAELTFEKKCGSGSGFLFAFDI